MNLINEGVHLSLYFWRTHSGQEVDFVLEYGGGIQAIEVKAGMTVSPTAVRILQKAIGEWKAKTVSPSIVYGGREENKIQNCRIIPWEKLGRKLFENIV